VEIVTEASRQSGMGLTDAFIVSRNLPEPPQHSVPEVEPKRRRVAIMFADIVGSTELVAGLGDENWLILLNSYYSVVRRELSIFHCWYLSAAGDGFLAAFDNCIRAFRCSAAIRAGARALGLGLRIGVHSGECVALGGFLTGLTLHIGARIAAAAAPGEILVSDHVKAHLNDTDVEFVERGSHRLRGVPGEWLLFAGCPI
jgi:class 3 adenylate cyclase